MHTATCSTKQRNLSTANLNDKAWINQELKGAYFKDERLGKRLQTLLGLMSNGIGNTISLTCQDWANTKAAYRFFSNPRISEVQILSGHFASAQVRANAVNKTLLVLHDTTEFVYQTENKSIGLLTDLPFPSKRRSKFRGLLMHSSLALTTEGIPLGLLSAKFWTRKAFKGTNALKRKINPTRISIDKKESFRWLENIRQSSALLDHPADCVHIADREGDIYELFVQAGKLGTNLANRFVGN